MKKKAVRCQHDSGFKVLRDNGILFYKCLLCKKVVGGSPLDGVLTNGELDRSPKARD